MADFEKELDQLFADISGPPKKRAKQQEEDNGSQDNIAVQRLEKSMTADKIFSIFSNDFNLTLHEIVPLKYIKKRSVDETDSDGSDSEEISDEAFTENPKCEESSKACVPVLDETKEDEREIWEIPEPGDEYVPDYDEFKNQVTALNVRWKRGAAECATKAVDLHMDRLDYYPNIILEAEQENILKKALQAKWKVYRSHDKKWLMLTKRHFDASVWDVEVHQIIGNGAFGVVWKLIVNEEPYALKLIDLKKSATLESSAETVFERESVMELLSSERLHQDYWLKIVSELLGQRSKLTKDVVLAAFTIGNKKDNVTKNDFFTELESCIITENPPDLKMSAAVLFECHKLFEAGLDGLLGYDREGASKFVTDVSATISRRGPSASQTLEKVVSVWEEKLIVFSWEDFSAEQANWWRFKGRDDFHGGESGVNVPEVSFLIMKGDQIRLGLVTPFEDISLSSFLLSNYACTKTSENKHTQTYPSTRVRYFAARLIQSLAEQVQNLHSVRCVHRDIKPANILGELKWHEEKYYSWQSQMIHYRRRKIAYFEPVLSDFSLTRRMPDREGSTETSTVNNVTDAYVSMTAERGDSYYMAPEVIGSGGYSEKVDIFSLGVVYYEILFVNPAKRKEELSSLRERIAVGQNPMPRYVQVLYPLESLILEEMLSSDAASRPTAAQLARKVDKTRSKIDLNVIPTLVDDMWIECMQFRRSTKTLDDQVEDFTEDLDLSVRPDRLLKQYKRMRETLEMRLGSLNDEDNEEKQESIERELENLQSCINYLRLTWDTKERALKKSKKASKK